TGGLGGLGGRGGMARAIRIMHAAMVTGVSIAGVVFVVLVRLVHMSFGLSADLGRLLAAIGLGIIVVAVYFLRPRIPQRPGDQSPDDYWTRSEIRGAAVLLWVVIEGAGLIGWIGYLLTSSVAPALTSLISILSLILVSPSRIEGNA
ncbi:MAG TPA: hypothetical protein VG454_14055, partial [Gemmatimonadales bacterium]|nr:hypothetical protein [Gemmatimonadales bacterium]